MYAPSLPAIAQNLSLSQAFTRALSAFFFVGLTVSVPVFGVLSDRYGRKPMIIISIIISIAGNLFSLFAPNGDILALCRFLAGLGAGGMVVNARTVIKDSFHDHSSLIQAFAIYAAVAQLSPAIAPSLGGVIQHNFGWRMNFLVITAINIMTLLLIIFSFKETLKERVKLAFIPTIKTMLGFLHNRALVVYSIISGLASGISINFFNTAPFVLEHRFHLSATETGLALITMPLAMVLGANTSRRMVQRTQNIHPRVILYSLLLLIASSLFYVLSHLIHAWILTILFGAALGVITGLIAPLLTGGSLATVSGSIGIASATQGLIKIAFTAVSLLVTLFVLAKTNTDLALINILSSVLFLLPLLFFKKQD